MEMTILLTLIVPDGKKTCIRCDSVRFSVQDGVKNKNAGGSVGIRPGHTDALMAVDAGQVMAGSAGKTVLQCTVDAGLAMVDRETVTILTDRVIIQSLDEAYLIQN